VKVVYLAADVSVKTKDLDRHLIETREQRRDLAKGDAEFAPFAGREDRGRGDTFEAEPGHPQHDPGHSLLALSECGDALELGNAVDDDQHVLGNRKPEEIVVLGVAVQVEQRRRHARLKRATRLVG
jgi:hypothetical protein